MCVCVCVGGYLGKHLHDVAEDGDPAVDRGVACQQVGVVQSLMGERQKANSISPFFLPVGQDLPACWSLPECCRG